MCLDGEPDVFADAVDVHGDRSSPGRELDRVAEQIGEHLENACGIERRERQRRHDPGHESDPAGRRPQPKRLHGLRHGLGRVSHLAGHRKPGGLDARHVDEIPDKPLHPGHRSLRVERRSVDDAAEHWAVIDETANAVVSRAWARADAVLAAARARADRQSAALSSL